MGFALSSLFTGEKSKSPKHCVTVLKPPAVEGKAEWALALSQALATTPCAWEAPRLASGPESALPAWKFPESQSTLAQLGLSC